MAEVRFGQNVAGMVTYGDQHKVLHATNDDDFDISAKGGPKVKAAKDDIALAEVDPTVEPVMARVNVYPIAEREGRDVVLIELEDCNEKGEHRLITLSADDFKEISELEIGTSIEIKGANHADPNEVLRGNVVRTGDSHEVGVREKAFAWTSTALGVAFAVGSYLLTRGRAANIRGLSASAGFAGAGFGSAAALVWVNAMSDSHPSPTLQALSLPPKAAGVQLNRGQCKPSK